MDTDHKQQLSFTDIADALAVNNANFFQTNLTKILAYRTPLDMTLPSGTPMANFGKISNGTVLMLAAMFPKISPVIIDILKQGLARFTDSMGRTALIIAACKDVPHVCSALAPLEANMRNSSLRSALMWACRLGNINCVRILSEWEDVNAIDANGVSVLEWAKKGGNQEIISIIEAAIKRQALKAQKDNETKLQVESLRQTNIDNNSVGINDKKQLDTALDVSMLARVGAVLSSARPLNNSGNSVENIISKNSSLDNQQTSIIQPGEKIVKLDLSHCAINASGLVQCQICYGYQYPSSLEAHLITCKKNLENRGLLKVVFERIKTMGASNLDDNYLMNCEHMNVIKALLPNVIGTCDENGTFCLLVAAISNNLLAASLFAEKEIFMSDKKGTTAIQAALQLGKTHLDMVRLLYSVESISSNKIQKSCGAMNGLCKFKGTEESVALHKKERCPYRPVKCILCGEENIPVSGYLINHLLSINCPILRSILEKSQTRYSIREFIEYVLSVLIALNSSNGGIVSIEHMIRTLKKLLEQINNVWENTRRLLASSPMSKSTMGIVSEQQACSDISIKASIAVIYEENIAKINNFNRSKESLDTIFEMPKESITENEYSVVIYLLFKRILEMLDHQ